MSLNCLSETSFLKCAGLCHAMLHGASVSPKSGSDDKEKEENMNGPSNQPRNTAKQVGNSETSMIATTSRHASEVEDVSVGMLPVRAINERKPLSMHSSTLEHLHLYATGRKAESAGRGRYGRSSRHWWSQKSLQDM